VWSGASAIPVEAPMPAAVAVVDAEVPVAVEAVGAPEPAEEAPAPLDAVPLSGVPEHHAPIVTVLLDRYPEAKFHEIVRALQAVIQSRPGQVVVALSVRGAGSELRLKEGVQWDEQLEDAMQRAAGVPVAVELRPGVQERLA
jgi:hypothetical protein